MTEESIHHEEWESLVAVAALEGLSADEAARVENHLAGCEECRHAFAEYRLVAEQLSANIPMVQAPPDLESKLRVRLRAQEGLSATPIAPRRRVNWTRWLTIAATLAILALIAQNVTLQRALNAQQAEIDTLRAVLVAPEIEPILLDAQGELSAAGRFVWARGNPVGSLVVDGLAPTSDETAYQLWLTRSDGTVDSGGLFRVSLDGSATLAVPAPSPWRNYVAIGVSEEPVSGSLAPTSDWILEGDFQ